MSPRLKQRRPVGYQGTPYSIRPLSHDTGPMRRTVISRTLKPTLNMADIIRKPGMSNHTKNYRRGNTPNNDKTTDRDAPASEQGATQRKRARMDTSTSNQPIATNRTNTSDKRNSRQRTPNTKLNNPNPAYIIQWNICGLRGRLPEFQLITNEYNPKIIALQETMFDNSKYYDKLNGSKYKWYIKPGPVKIRNGVAIAIDKNTPHKELKLTTDLQAIACRTVGNKATTYVSIYIPPGKLTPTELTLKLQDLIDQIPKPFLLMGDFNAHSTAWGSYKDDRHGKAILKLTEKNDLKILNNGNSTKVSNNFTCLSAIDLTLASIDFNMNLQWTVDIDSRGSDHFPIIMSDPLTTTKNECKPQWMLKKANWEKFQNSLIISLPIEEDHNMDRITTAIYEAALDSIPRTNNKKKHNTVPWWNPEVEKHISDRRAALKELKKHKANDDTKQKLATKLRKANKKAQKVIKKAKKESWETFLNEINSDSDPTELWGKVNALSGKKRKEEITLLDNNAVINDHTEIANKLADYFYEQSATDKYSPEFQRIKETHEKRPMHLKKDTKSNKYNENFTITELNQALSDADGKAAGPDTISYDMLRHLPIDTKTSLLKEYNRIWNEGPLPTSWKTGIIIPIPKGGENKHIVSNYRPISLLNCLGKILEKMVNNRLITELEKNNRLNTNQFAFRPGKGTDDYFNELEHLISEPISKGKHVECALLDISKAYDRAWRRPILDKLTKWNINGNMIRYINDFLTDRKFQVAVGTATSDTKEQENGIPQGAVISVTLFLIAMDSVFEQIRKKKNKNVKILVYADDIIIIVIGERKKKLRAKLQKCVNKITEWANSIGFSIAPLKSKMIHLCKVPRHKPLPNITINNEIVPMVNSAKLLGVIIDSKLTFKQHITDLRKNLINRCNLIKSICGKYNGADRKTLLRIFEAIVVSKIMYGAHLYSRGKEKEIERIAPLYNQTIRSITGAHRTSPVSSILAEAGMLPLKTRIKLTTITKAIKWAEKNVINTTTESPLMTRANTFAVELTGESIPNIAPAGHSRKRKWHEQRPTIDWSIKLKIKAGSNPTIAQQTFKETLAKYTDHKKIYTDGSLANNSVGCGVTDLNSNQSTKLNKMCNIFSAEALALVIATKEFTSNDQPTVIFTDSASCLSALEAGNHDHSWIQEIGIASKNRNITYCWVPGHAGIKGNEIADKLANDGRNKDTENPYVPAHDAIEWFKKETITVHDYDWRRNNTSFLRQSKQSTYKWKDRKKVDEQKVLTRLRIGHTWLSHSYLLRKEDAPKCKICNHILTADHIIRECIGYTEQRAKYQTESIAIYNNNEINEQNLIDFLKETETFTQM